jgi:hypothetical protein
VRTIPSVRAIRRAVVLATFTSALAIGPAAAAGPEKVPNGASTIVWEAGTLCSFEVAWDIPAVGSTLIFPVTANGDQLIRQVGPMIMTVTNTDSGAVMDLRGGVKLDLVFHADGSLDAHISGAVTAGYFPTDIGGPSMWFYRGHLHDVLTADFTAVGHTFTGNATDLCAALS